MTSLELQLFESLLPWRNAPAWRVAFSGGLDSTVLLHLLVGLGRLEPEAVQDILNHGKRTATVPTARPHGLFLWKVFY